MLQTTFISRASDGLILCETYDAVTDSKGNLNLLIDPLNIFCISGESEAECEAAFEEVAKRGHLMHSELRELQFPVSHCSSPPYINCPLFLSYMIRNGVAFLTLAENKYPQKLAFLYLQDIADSFMDELKNTYGTTGGIDY